MKLILLTIIIVAFCILGLSFNIIFRKNGKFPDGEIGHNKALRKEGINCMKTEEHKLWGKNGSMKKKEQSSIDEGECDTCGEIDCIIKSLKEEKKKKESAKE